MADKFVAGVAPTPAERNKRTIMSGTLAERDALTASEKKKGTHFYVDEQFQEYVWNGTSWIPIGGGSVDYPNWSHFEAIDHFMRVTLEPGGPDLYLGLGSSTSFGIFASGNDEYYSHAATPEGNLTTATQGGFYGSFSIWHSKSNAIRSVTKAKFKFKVKFVRTASLKLGCGLIDGTAANGDPSQVVDKIVIQVDGTGNFFARVSGGAAETTLDCGVSDDNFHDWEFVWQSSGVEVFLDGVSKGTITTNLPDRPLQPAPHLIRNDTGANDGLRDVIMDYWHYRGE